VPPSPDYEIGADEVIVCSYTGVKGYDEMIPILDRTMSPGMSNFLFNISILEIDHMVPLTGIVHNVANNWSEFMKRICHHSNLRYEFKELNNKKGNNYMAAYELTLDENGSMIGYESKPHSAKIMNDAIIEYRKLQVSTVKTLIDRAMREVVAQKLKLKAEVEGGSSIVSSRHCVVGRDPRAPANRIEDDI